jgi:cardiolipin synthase
MLYSTSVDRIAAGARTDGHEEVVQPGHFLRATTTSFRRIPATGQPIGWCLAIALCIILPACAALPDVKDLNTSLVPRATPAVKTAKGPLGKEQARSLLARRWANSATDITKLAALEEAATGVPLLAGNKLTLLFDGPQTLAAMSAAVAAAKDNINLETYIFDQDELGMRFADLLIARQKDGVQVSIIYDSVGTIGTPEAFFQRMRDAGIRLTAFNPVNPLAHFGRWQLNNRDHRKILIVDGRVAFTGGINISGSYSSSSFFRSGKRVDGKIGWRDTHVRIEGPAVAALQWAFVETWARQQQDELPERNFFPPLTNAGDKIVRVIASDPGGDYQIFRAYILAIQEAKKSIHLTTAYFVPDRQMIEALSNAARRGVDVKIVLPGVPEVGPVFHAGRSFYSELLAGGVKIHELKLAVLHAKTAVIDGVWSTVGSTNLDMRSFVYNNEINIVILGDSFGAEMEKAFDEDLRGSTEIKSEKWEQRSYLDRIKEWSARAFENWL